jgi:2-dehydro-3-deoxyphosphogluconate aldolase/(4S)-4-hydroxy-2-oxoglutarate aldolase
MANEDLIDSLERGRIAAVMIIDDVHQAVPAAQALIRGGVTHIELALRTDHSMDALKAIVDEVPEMVVGAGTVLSPEQVEAIKEAGASFAVSPGLNPDVVAAANSVSLPFAPGVATPTDIETAYKLGCTTMKLFPAEPLGGPTYLSSVNVAYRHLGLRFIPLGGVNLENINRWLSMPEVVAVGGSWISKRALIKQERWEVIEVRAREAMDHIRAGLNEEQ